MFVMPALFGLLWVFVIVSNVQTKQSIPLCSCSQAAQCADAGFARVQECKRECARWLHAYASEGGKPDALVDCFGREIDEERGNTLNECMRKRAPQYCSATNSQTTIAEPDYGTWMETLNSTVSADSGTVSRSAFVRKSRAAFIAFRNFQKCNNNCARRHAMKCFQKASCAVSLPADRIKAQRIFNACTKQADEARNARDSCRCLIQKHKCYQLVGICPLFSAAYLQRML